MTNNMFDHFEKRLLKQLVTDELENVERGHTSYGTKEDNLEIIEELKSILNKLEYDK